MGVSLGAGAGSAGLSIFASVNGAKGHEKGDATLWSETTLDSGGDLSITSGRDTILSGAQVNGNRVTADIGRDLTITSLQDSDNYDAKQSSFGAGGSFSFGSMTGSGYVNASQDKMHSSYSSVLEQSGIYAGEGGFDITVGSHTQLNGAVIASQADAGKNRLETGTLGFTDMDNQADYKTEHQGAGISSGVSMGGQFAGNMANTLLAGAGSKGHAEGTTQSAVAEGTIVVRDQASQQQNLADLSRDPEHANDSISPIFNKEKEQKRLQTAQMIAEIGVQVADIAATQGALSGLDTGTGSEVQRSIQAVTAALQGLAGGDVVGALAGASAPELAHLLKGTESDPVANTLAHALLGGVMASLQGNNAATGALGAASGELAAKAIIAALYPGKTAGELSESEKQTVSMLATVSAGIAGGLAGGNTAGTVTGAQAGKNAVENNSLADIAQAQSEGKTVEKKAGEYVEAENERYKKANCGGMSAEACSVMMYTERREALKEMVSLGADFVPVVGDIKSFAEAQSALDYLVAAIGIIPGAGDAAGKVIKAAEAALKKGDVAEASKLINKASDEISAKTPTGSKGNPLNIIDGQNKPKVIGNRDYSGHSLDRMQRQGITPSTVENAIRPENAVVGKRPGTTAYYDSKNNITVITDTKTGTIVTVDFGRIKQ